MDDIVVTEVIKLDDLRISCYKELLEYICETIGFMPPIIREDNKFFFKRNKVVKYIMLNSGVNFTSIWDLFDHGIFSEEDLVSFYVSYGYSLCGLLELFEKFYLKDENV